MPQITLQAVDYMAILPEIVLTAFGILVMVADPLAKAPAVRRQLGYVALLGALASVAATFVQWTVRARSFGPAFFGMLQVDTFSVFFHFLIGGIAVVAILSSWDYLETQELRNGEYYALILFGSVGMMLMSSAVELVLIFIALEISSISTYILAGYRRRAPESVESALKYFLLGSFATAFFLYGVALIFGATATTNIYDIGRVLRSDMTNLAYVAVALMLVGLSFKIAAAPFHVWTPDVYEGAPSPVVGLMSTAPKAAVFAVMARILFAGSAPGWFWIIWVLAALSMSIGNIGALVQNNVKRMLAYSSIAHAGYLLVAFAALPELGITAALFYTASYAAMNVGAFAVISYLAGHGERYVTLDDYAGLGKRAPGMAAMLTLFLLSLIGIPLTGGFFAKFYVFNAALRANLVGLVIVGLINSAVASYYYLRIMVYMYMKDGREDVPLRPVTPSLAAALALSALATLYLGILPQTVLDLATRSAQELLQRR